VPLAIGLVVVGYGTNQYLSQEDSLEQYESVTGTVIESDVDRELSVDRSEAYEFQPEVEYRYKYENATYNNSNIYPGQQSGRKYSSVTEAKQVTEPYTEGSEITVYIPSSKPRQAFIENTGSGRPLTTIAVGMLFLIATVFKVVRT
jgi:hypothetical protein